MARDGSRGGAGLSTFWQWVIRGMVAVILVLVGAWGGGGLERLFGRADYSGLEAKLGTINDNLVALRLELKTHGHPAIEGQVERNRARIQDDQNALWLIAARLSRIEGRLGIEPARGDG